MNTILFVEGLVLLPVQSTIRLHFRTLVLQTKQTRMIHYSDKLGITLTP